jgi:hypothetical protein
MYLTDIGNEITENIETKKHEIIWILKVKKESLKINKYWNNNPNRLFIFG